MAIKEKRYRRIEGDYLVSGGEYTDDNGNIIMSSRYAKKLNIFSRLLRKTFALREQNE